jgi:hypothetical protein
MAKDASEVNPSGKAVFYAVLFNDFRKAALDNGYALALHGSMVSDMDMIAVPWVENCSNPETLVKAIDGCIGHTVWKDHNLKPSTDKPHGRIVYTIRISGDWYIDLSIMPAQHGS